MRQCLAKPFSEAAIRIDGLRELVLADESAAFLYHFLHGFTGHAFRSASDHALCHRLADNFLAGLADDRFLDGLRAGQELRRERDRAGQRPCLARQRE